MPAWFRTLIALEGLIALGAGLALLIDPDWTNEWWPWLLTPLTARAMAAWVLGLAVVCACAWWENDFERVQVAFVSFVLLSLLQLLALARYDDDLGDGARIPLYLGVLVFSFVMGAYGLARASRGPNRRAR
jgi:hypothetical protein